MFLNLSRTIVIKIGENLYSKDRKITAQVLADSSISYKGEVGSIHKISATVLKKSNNNGWDFWYVIRNNKLVAIDSFRYDYDYKYLKSNKIKHTEIQFNNNVACEPDKTFLTYADNEL